MSFGCRVSARSLPKFLVGASYLVEFRENRPVTVWEILINILTCPVLQWWGKWNCNPESVYARVYLEILTRGISVVSGGGRVRGEDLNLTAMYTVSMISSIWSRPWPIGKYFFFKCRPRPTVVYTIVIYRQPCALHISWYTVHHPSGGSSLCWVRGIQLFSGCEYSPYGVAT